MFENMKKIIKILIGISILCLCLGIVSAANFNEIFTAPPGLEAVGNNDFVDQQGHNIMIMEYKDENVQTWLQNDTDPEYLVQKYNDTCYIGTDDENDCYIFEIVEKDGSKYIVSSWTPKGPDETKIIQNNLLEFNKLNHLTPMPIED